MAKKKKPGAKKSFCSALARDAKSQLCGVLSKSMWRRREDQLSLRNFGSKIIFHSEIGRHVLTPFFGMCQSDGQAANEEMGQC